jgi:hypothetical protein
LWVSGLLFPGCSRGVPGGYPPATPGGPDSYQPPSLAYNQPNPMADSESESKTGLQSTGTPGMVPPGWYLWDGTRRSTREYPRGYPEDITMISPPANPPGYPRGTPVYPQGYPPGYSFRTWFGPCAPCGTLWDLMEPCGPW